MDKFVPLTQSIGDMYDLVRLNEKQELTNPSKDTVGNLKQGQEVYGPKPKLVGGPEKAKIKSDRRKEVCDPECEDSEDIYSSDKFKGSKPSKEKSYDDGAKPEKHSEDDFDDVTPGERKAKKLKEKISNYTMNTFENMFRKVITEDELKFDTEDGSVEEVENEEDLDDTVEVEEVEVEESDDDSDVLSDLKELRDKVDAVIARLESSASEESEEVVDGEDEEFDQEFSDEDEEEEPVVKESKKLAKGHKLLSKQNKVGNVSPKGKKASIGKAGKLAKDGKKVLTKGAKVKSTVQKGGFMA